MEGESDEVVWSKDSVVKVIELYRERPVLWDATSYLYKDKNKKHYAWQEIADEMNTSKLEVKNKIRNLTIQFKREVKKPKNGSGADPYKKKWFALDHLMFLKDTTTPRHFRESAGPNTSDSIPEGIAVGGSINETDGSPINLNVDANEGQIVSADKSDANMETLSLQSTTAKRLGPSQSTQQTRKRIYNRNPIAQEALNVMRNLGNNVKQKDEFDAFGEYVSSELRKSTNAKEVAIAKQRINAALFDLEMSNFPSFRTTPTDISSCHTPSSALDETENNSVSILDAILQDGNHDTEQKAQYLMLN